MPEFVLRAYLDAVTDHPLVIAGDGPYRPSLERLAVGRPSVTFAGYVDSPAQLLSEARALIFASDWEGMPNAILEAYSKGVPVIALDIPSVREVTAEGAYARLVRTRAEMRDEIERLSNDDAYFAALCQMSDCGYEYFREDANQARFAAFTEALRHLTHEGLRSGSA
ncbi:MAG: glycosyltransferase [Actinobacteria bacterium]|nr:glycosyltransferase [Actinomycetota bacterium]